MSTANELARGILTEHDAVLHRIAEELLERESLDGAEIYRIIKEMTGLDLGPPPGAKPTPTPVEDNTPEVAEGDERRPTGELPLPSPQPSS